MTVRVFGDKQLAAALRRAAHELADLTEPTRAAARAVERTAGRLAAKRTGRLAGSNRSTVRGGTAVITNAVRYAPFQEYGTSVMNAHPYLRPALVTTPVTDFYEAHADRVARRI